VRNLKTGNNTKPVIDVLLLPIYTYIFMFEEREREGEGEELNIFLWHNKIKSSIAFYAFLLFSVLLVFQPFRILICLNEY
jgi:hypothetical protein